jgi:tetratricopeptide (TPR) repeat protein
MTSALIAGQIGKALYIGDGRYLILDVEGQEESVEDSRGEVALFFDSGAEIRSVSDKTLNINQTSDLLQFYHQAYRAMTMALSGMNRDLSYETRALCIEAAEELLASDSIINFVQSRLLARPLPSVANVGRGIELAEKAGAKLLKSIYEMLTQSQRAIRLLLESWAEVAQEHFDVDEAQAVEQTMIEIGLFAEMVKALAANDIRTLNARVVAFGMSSESRSIRQGFIIANELRTRVIEKYALSEGKRFNRQDAAQADAYSDDESEDFSEEKDRVKELISRFNAREWNWKPSRAHEALEKIASQIAAISKLIRQGNLHRAEDFLCNLLEFHLQHSEKEHVAMSLCSLAKVALDANEFDFADSLVHSATLLEVDDAVIETTQAEILKARGRFDEALAEYKKVIERFPDNVVARNGYAEVLKGMGQLDEALAEYKKVIERFPDDVVARASYAEVLKGMGQLDKASAEYKRVIERFPDNVVARSGYAEVLKEMGQLDRALAEYERITDQFPLDRVARTGRATLLILNNRFEEARRLMSEQELVSRDDWIDYHVVAISYLREGNFKEAIPRLDFGLKNAVWTDVNTYFATALGFAKILNRDFVAAEQVLTSNVVPLHSFQKQSHLILIGHSQAAQGKVEKAARTLNEVPNTGNPTVVNIKDALAKRYNLAPGQADKLAESEISRLDKEITEKEFLLVLPRAA